MWGGTRLAWYAFDLHCMLDIVLFVLVKCLCPTAGFSVIQNKTLHMIYSKQKYNPVAAFAIVSVKFLIKHHPCPPCHWRSTNRTVLHSSTEEVYRHHVSQQEACHSPLFEVELTRTISFLTGMSQPLTVPPFHG